jgi:hypothetical protein
VSNRAWYTMLAALFAASVGAGCGGAVDNKPDGASVDLGADATRWIWIYSADLPPYVEPAPIDGFTVKHDIQPWWADLSPPEDMQ